jgi:hypothetical protein
VSPYEVLGVAPSATAAELRRAYLCLARRHHPDAGGDPEVMRQVNAAWSVVGDPAARAAFDRSRDGAHAAFGAESSAPDVASVWTELLDEDDDGGHGMVVPRWAAMLPVALLATAVATLGAGLLIGWAGLVAAGVATLVLSGALFVATPFLALAGARRSGR